MRDLLMAERNMLEYAMALNADDPTWRRLYDRVVSARSASRRFWGLQWAIRHPFVAIRDWWSLRVASREARKIVAASPMLKLPGWYGLALGYPQKYESRFTREARSRWAEYAQTLHKSVVL